MNRKGVGGENLVLDALVFIGFIVFITSLMAVSGVPSIGPQCAAYPEGSCSPPCSWTGHSCELSPPICTTSGTWLDWIVGTACVVGFMGWLVMLVPAIMFTQFGWLNLIFMIPVAAVLLYVAAKLMRGGG